MKAIFFVAMSFVLFVSLAGCGHKNDDGGDPAVPGNGNPGSGSNDDQNQDNLPDFASTGLAGKVAGKDWKMITGKATPEKLGDHVNLTFDMYDFQPVDFMTNEPLDDVCKAWPDFDHPGVSVFFDNAIKTGGIGVGYENGLNRMLTFSYEDEHKQMKNFGTIHWRVRIDKRTDTELAGVFVGRYDDTNSINGTFDVKICPAPQALK